MPEEIREQTIRDLVRAAGDGMALTAKGATANEVFSAYMTMASHGIAVAKKLGVPADSLRAVLLQILVECDDSTLRVM